MKKHIIGSGDTLEKLSAFYGVPICMIVKKNGTGLKIGRTIYIPDLDMCSLENSEYTVQSGDTVYSIAEKFNTSMAKVMKMNNAGKPEDITVGAKIKVPCEKNDYLVYSVKMTETVKEIAEKFGVSASAIAGVNKLGGDLSLYQGMQLFIPTGEKNAKNDIGGRKR